MDKDLLKETEKLYFEIDSCIDNIVGSRLRKDEIREQQALLNMESIMCRALQYLQCILDFYKE